jgi:hypothetical protein
MPGSQEATMAQPAAIASSSTTGRPSWSPCAAGAAGTTNTSHSAMAAATPLRSRLPRKRTLPSSPRARLQPGAQRTVLNQIERPILAELAGVQCLEQHGDALLHCEPADEQDPAALPLRLDRPHGGHVGAHGADQRGARIGAELEEALTHLLVRHRDGGRAAQGEPFEAGGEPPARA